MLDSRREVTRDEACSNDRCWVMLGRALALGCQPQGLTHLYPALERVVVTRHRVAPHGLARHGGGERHGPFVVPGEPLQDRVALVAAAGTWPPINHAREKDTEKNAVTYKDRRFQKQGLERTPFGAFGPSKSLH